VQSVTIIGPNLLDQSKGGFHVHGAGCRDITRQARRDPAFRDGWTITVASREAVAEVVYADIIAENEGATPADYLGEFYFAPCVTVPVTAHEALLERGDELRAAVAEVISVLESWAIEDVYRREDDLTCEELRAAFERVCRHRWNRVQRETFRHGCRETRETIAAWRAIAREIGTVL
jgi:hypothetical protein